MNRLDFAFKWAQHHEFTAQELIYATILQLKILDQKCQMSSEDQTLFMHVYEGIKYKPDSPFNQIIHNLIEEATGDSLEAKASYKNIIHQQRKSYESTMERPLMKAYKAMVRQSLETALAS